MSDNVGSPEMSRRAFLVKAAKIGAGVAAVAATGMGVKSIKDDMDRRGAEVERNTKMPLPQLKIGARSKLIIISPQF